MSHKITGSSEDVKKEDTQPPSTASYVLVCVRTEKFQRPIEMNTIVKKSLMR